MRPEAQADGIGATMTLPIGVQNVVRFSKFLPLPISRAAATWGLLNTKGDFGGWKKSLAFNCASSSGFVCSTTFSAASETVGDLDGV